MTECFLVCSQAQVLATSLLCFSACVWKETHESQQTAHINPTIHLESVVSLQLVSMLSLQREKLGRTLFCRGNGLENDPQSCDFHFCLCSCLIMGLIYFRPTLLIIMSVEIDSHRGKSCRRLEKFYAVFGFTCCLVWPLMFVVNMLFSLLPWFEMNYKQVVRWV